MWGGALPAPTACLPASRHLRSPTLAVLLRPFVLEVGSCWVKVPRRRGPHTPLGRERTLASPHSHSLPQTSPPGPNGPFLRALMPPFRAGLRQPPSSGSQAFSMSSLLPSHSSATSEVSGKRVREVDARGRRNHVAVAAQRIPRDAFRTPPHPTPGTRRRGRGFPAPPQGGRPAPPPLRCGALGLTTHPAWVPSPQLERRGHRSSRQGRRTANERSLPHPTSRERPASPLRRAQPEASRDCILSTVTTALSLISHSGEGGAT